ncbi:F-box-like domain superfamily [Arabidopsis suecica]|uniref:RNI-like superfamily protein n=2 Tax=Arabidopsis TaxID=3701 RepID=A0A1P8B8H9_ARATH|nr:RNI-like superfamily protein [Arabidopsis thaliana]NP_001329695.1 RNI-like superfamily protein [Arabidopsis thaliana]NP_001329696.1 RNI-like superfamily protein [Arabidopsis thaliana]NP_001329697.1 RNI-like superfamily protein [Arabidopsis thaliana]NP_001329698.1 RNI-like superfamily protein [Arabidopsis thaliana]NP_001329699.1 RNI-like superfamily protein [Arabidopsis thaliana]KAG7619421.1 F-box-like domain superfamily [Arabidopsis suecica]AEE82225.2 RNI-like superfamily protein [Arabido|eukprot:NP_001319852.1 RNI-like superfamily protein [Arabidopsis thaliana]
MDAPNPKRPCLVPLGTSSIENPCSLPIAPDFNQSNIDLTISSFLSLSDLPLFSLPLSIGCSFDRVLDNVIPSIAGTSRDEFDQDRFLDRTLQLASLLYKSTKRCIRKRATLQNSTSWPLLPELTIKVFSMLDTKSLMQASACCTMFNKCAMDRVCYSHIDLTTAAEDVDNGVVCVMIHRAGKELRSLKLGSISSSAEPTTSLLTRSCLTPLTFNHGFTGGHLRSLHLYHLRMIDCGSLSPVLSACLNLTDLKIVGLISGSRDNPLEQLGLLTRNCRLIEHLFIEIYGAAGLITDSSLLEFAANCPNLSSISLLGFLLNDAILQKLIKGFRRLKHINLSSSPEISGCFFRGLELCGKDSPLETLILRDCYILKESEVLLFLNSLLAGDFKYIRLIDVSNVDGLVCDGGNRTFEPRFPIEELKKQRSNVTFVAIFESQSSLSSSSSGEVYSDGTSSWTSNYNSAEEEHDNDLDSV